MKKFAILGLALMLGGALYAQPRSASAPRMVMKTADAGLMAPVWSPDGSLIAATTDGYRGILVASADGSSAIRTVTLAPGAGYKMVWKDNNEIVGRTDVRSGAAVLHEMRSWDVASGRSVLIAPAARTASAPSAARGGRIYEAMLADAASAASRIDALAAFAGEIVINPALSPDGSRIAFQIPGRGMWTIGADGSGLRSIGAGSHPSWLADNATVIYTVVEDDGQQFTASKLMARNVDSGAAVTLLDDSRFIPMTAAASPDGLKVAFENASEGAIYVITLNY